MTEMNKAVDDKQQVVAKDNKGTIIYWCLQEAEFSS